MKPLALRWRISICAALMLITAIGVIWIIAYIEFQGLMLSYIDDTLLVVSRGNISIMDDAPDASEPAEIRALMGVVKEGSLYVYRIWLDNQPEDIYSSQPPTESSRRLREAIQAQQPPPFGDHKFFGEQLGPGGYRAIWLRARTFRGPTNIVVARFGNIRPQELHEFLMVLMPAAALTLLLGIVATVFMVRWALRPVQQTADTIADVTAQNVGKVQLNEAKAPPELQPFVKAVSDMLIRLDNAFASQKRLVSNASHELRTPLALAKSTLQAARIRDRDIVTYKRMVDDTLGDLVRMEHLIEEMLVLAKLDVTDGITNPTTLELDELLQRVANRVLADPNFSGERLVCQIEPARIRGNEGQLSRVFANLLDNAIKYGPKDGKIFLTAAKSGNHVLVCVRDEGGSIPAESIPSLFERFFRLDSSRSSATGGAGLGLSIAREITIRHDGEISMSSDIKSGTIVKVLLPALA